MADRGDRRGDALPAPWRLFTHAWRDPGATPESAACQLEQGWKELARRGSAGAGFTRPFAWAEYMPPEPGAPAMLVVYQPGFFTSWGLGRSN